MSPPTRRSVLRSATGLSATGLLGVESGATASTARAQPDVGLEISTLGQFTALRGTNVTSSTLQVDVEGDGGIEFGGDAPYSVRLEREGSDDALRFEPLEDADTYTVDTVHFETAYDPEAVNDESGVLVSEADELGREDMDGRYLGDVDLFDQDSFAHYRAQLLDGDDAVVAESPPKRVATRYQWELEQPEETLRITRDPDVREEFFVQFAVYEVGDRPTDELDQIEVDHADGDDHFEIDLSQFDIDLEESLYDWDLEIYESPDDWDYLLSLSSDGGENDLLLPYEEPEPAAELPAPGALATAGTVAGTVGGLHALRNRGGGDE